MEENFWLNISANQIKGLYKDAASFIGILMTGKLALQM